MSARRSFEIACANRLVERIRAQAVSSCRPPVAGSTLPALLNLYDAERVANEEALKAQGIDLLPGRERTSRKTANVLAEHHGRSAAETISLVLQIGSDKTPSEAMRPKFVSQMDFAF